MAQKRHIPEQIIRKLREVEVAQGKGKTTPQAVKQIGVTEQTFYRWRKEYPNTNRSVLAASSGFRFSSKCP